MVSSNEYKKSRAQITYRIPRDYLLLLKSCKSVFDSRQMRKQYYHKRSANGWLVWDVHNLVERSKNLPVFEIPISEISELSGDYWYQGDSDIPTCRSIVEHMKLVLECDLKYPIILAADGSVMDGMHRACKAYLNELSNIKAVRFKVTPKPDFINLTQMI